MAYNSNENTIKQFGSYSSNKDTRGGSTTVPSAVIGIVKNNVDPTHSGKLEVYLVRQDSGTDVNNPKNWTPVNYMSPFFGYTATTSSTSDDGKYVGNPNSYGMWMTPPDINTEVICIFLNGDVSQGYYIGCLPNPGVNQMVPAIGSSSKIIANSGEASGYGGATILPVSEINNANPSHSKNPNLVDQPRTIHSYQAMILNKQGLIRDSDRGTISSSAARESPSRVFGISTPGRPIYKGGYTDDTIQGAVSDSSTPDDKFSIIGRLGGHTLVMDDGDLVGKDQLMRLRTASGHMIMMNDKAQTLFIIHANGKSYIELGKEGTIDLFSMNSVNIRTQGDLNLHADNNVNIKATKDVNISGENLNMESLKATSQFTGTTYKGYVKGDYTEKVEGKMSTESTGEFGLKSKKSAVVLDGTNVKLNSGNPALVPEIVKQLPIVQHPDTLYDSSKGWVSAPGKLSTTVSRAPAHTPWAYANMGVDVNVDPSAKNAFPSAPGAAVQAANASAPASPNATVSGAIASAAPSVTSTNPQLDTQTSRSMLGQAAVSAATGSSADIVKTGAGLSGNTPVLGPYGLTPAHLEDAGYIKPGASSAVGLAVSGGKDIASAMPSNIFTGKDGITNVNQFLADSNTQGKVVNQLFDKAQQDLKTMGVLNGTENPSQVAGVVMAGAMAGTAALKNVSGMSNIDPNAVTSALNTTPPPGAKDVLGLISAGNFAAGLVDKTMQAFSNLGGIDISAKFASTAAAIFGSIVSKFKSLAANVPQDLTSINSANAADALKAGINSAAASTAAAVSAGVSGTGLIPSQAVAASFASGLGNLPGGLEAVTNVVNNGAKAASDILNNALPQVPVVQTLTNIASAPGNIVGAATALTSGGASGLVSLATKGLDPSASNLLTAKISAMNSGTLDVKLPTVASNTVDTSSIENQAKGLLQDNRIPPSFTA